MGRKARPVASKCPPGNAARIYFLQKHGRCWNFVQGIVTLRQYRGEKDGEAELARAELRMPTTASTERELRRSSTWETIPKRKAKPEALKEKRENDRGPFSKADPDDDREDQETEEGQNKDRTHQEGRVGEQKK